MPAKLTLNPHRHVDDTFRLGTLIRRTSSHISSNQFLRFAAPYASIPKSRFFSNGTDGGSALYHHARLFRKPLSTGFKSNLSNSVSLMGFVHRPIRAIHTVEPDRFDVSTLLRVKDPRDQNRSFRPYLGMILLVIVTALAAAKSLEGQFNALRSVKEPEKELERAKSVKISVVSQDEGGNGSLEESSSSSPEKSAPTNI